MPPVSEESIGPAGPLHARTARLASLYAFGNLARRGIHFLLLPVYTTYLSRDDFGLLAMLTVTGGILCMLIVSPLITGALMRFYYHPAYRRLRGALLLNLALLVAVLSVALAAGWLALAGPIARVLFGRTGLANLARLYGLVLLLWPVSMLGLMFVKLRDMARLFVAVSLAECLASAGVIVVGLVFGLGVRAAVLGLAAGMAAAAVLCLPVVLRHCEFRLSASVLARPLRFGWPLLPTGLSRLVMQLGDRYVLRGFRPMGQIGLYQFGYGLSEAIDTAVGTPAHDGVGPTIRRLEDDPPRQRRFIRRSATAYYVLAATAGLVLSLLSPELVRLLAPLNRAYWSAWVVVPLLSFAFVQQALGFFLEWGMIMGNRSYHISGVLLFSAGVNVGLNFLLVPRFGILGAAAATAFSHLLWNALRGWCSLRCYDLRFDLRALGQATLLAVGLYLISLATGAGLGPWANLPVKLLLAAAFPVLCYATGVLDTGQRQAVRRFWRTLRTAGLRAAAREMAAGPADDRAGARQNSA